MPKYIGIIGNGRIAKECAAIIRSCPQDECVLTHIVIDASRNNISADFEKYCISNKIDCIVSKNINDQATIDYLRSGKLDLLFSINNHQIIRDTLLHLPEEGIINFHNGPLPRYGGLNACSWAIFNGEQRHGVTWHYVTAGVDDGDVVAQKVFDIDPNATALKLVMMCINEGINLFRQVVSDVLAGKIKRTPQDHSARLYYFAKDIPAGGQIDFHWNAERILQLIRALNYNPLESPLGHPAAMVNGRIFFIDEAKLVRHEQLGTSGQILRADDTLEIQALDAVLEVCDVRDEQKKRVPVQNLIKEYAIKEGMFIETGKNHE